MSAGTDALLIDKIVFSSIPRI